MANRSSWSSLGMWSKKCLICCLLLSVPALAVISTISFPEKYKQARDFFSVFFFSNAWICIWKLTICKNCHNPSNDTLLLSCCCFLSSFSGSFVGLLIGIILFLTLFSRTSGNNICNACPVTTPMLGQWVDSTVQRDTQYYHDPSTLNASKAMTWICKIMDRISFNNCNFFLYIIYIYISGGPLSALTCCVNVRLLSAIKKISPLIYSQSWVGSWVYTTQAMMTFTLIF